MNLPSIEHAVALAEQRWPGYQFKVTSNHEAHGPCPVKCFTGEDRFFFNLSGRYLCRQCRSAGWLDEEDVKLSAAEIRLRRIEAEQARQRRKQAELEQRLSALERMAHCTDHLEYHKLLDASDIEWWLSQGIHQQSIDEYQLGVCYACPTDNEHRPSYTIPVFDSSGTRLVNIRHRIIGATNGDKYRPHIAGLPRTLFDARNVLDHEELTLVEGEKKCVVLHEHDFPAVGIFGKNGFNLDWLRHFSGIHRLNIALDPDANGHAQALGEEVKQRAKHIDVRVCSFPSKPDDFLIEGGTNDDFRWFLEYGRRV